MSTTLTSSDRAGERGSALILALLVALILAFLGLGLLLQTSLGLQAAGADRWVAKSMHAAEAGLMMQIEMVQLGQLGGAWQFQLRDDDILTGPSLFGTYQVDASGVCELEPASPAIGWEWPKFGRRYFHARSEARRNVGNLVGLTQAAVEADISVWPFEMGGFTPITVCN